MKKLLSIAMATALVATCAAGVAVGAAALENAPAPAAETAQVYLVPGSWYDTEAKETKYNTVAGATALSSEEKTALKLEEEPNVYKAGAAGTELPTPATEHTDAEGEPFVFQGWWYIVNASVTYTEVVPEAKEDLYHYADFRAAFSQRHEPAAPPEQIGQGDKNFMEVTHEDGTVDYLPLLVSGTDQSGKQEMGYGTPVQFFNEYFELRHNDRIKVYLTDISEDSDGKPAAYPKRSSSGFVVTFEANGSGTNRTANYLCDDITASNKDDEYTMAYHHTDTMTFRVYIKVETNGRLDVYMEPKA